MNGETSTLSGPDELIAKLIEYRQTSEERRREAYGNITDDGVRRLVRLSYFASQSVEEGRYPRFRIYVPPEGRLPDGWRDPWQLVQFSEPVLLRDIDDLRRLTPSADSHDLALEIHDIAAAGETLQLACVGLRLAHSGESATEMCSTSLWARSVRPGLMIRIDAPGELRVSEGQNAWDLRAGKLTNLGGIVTQPFAAWFERVTKTLASDDQAERVISHTLHFAWHELLHLVSEQRRGGCLVVLPKASLTACQVEQDYGIRLKYQTDGPPLGKEIASFVRSCQSTAEGKNVTEFSILANQWLKERHKLLSYVDALTHIVGVDGCTVLDAELRLVGFGGKINISQPNVVKKLVDARTSRDLDTAIMAQTGTRHYSAYWLCQVHEEAWCYVVSQDTQVTAFWSDGEAVKRWCPYWPWAKTSDQF
jgi:hypothetical protein